jgi:hypothetical protein
VALALQSLDAEVLEEHHCLFGGGTAIVLSHGEYRESVDIDFLVSNLDGYRKLRTLLTGTRGLQAIVRAGSHLEPARELRADQYGVRTMLRVSGVEIKLEIVFESRIELAAPGIEDRICGIRTLTPLDMATTMLLANSDRWADDSVFSRDLIDLAMLEPSKKLRDDAIAKARVAYGDSIERDLAKAIERLKERPGRLDECMEALQIDRIPKALLWKRIRRLVPARPRSR